MNRSKPLGHADISGFEFTQEILANDMGYGINFDSLYYHPQRGYIVIELLLCEENQTVTPHESHPNRYWHKNSQKFIALWKATKALNGNLYLINYAKKNTRNSDKISVIKVLEIDNINGITKEIKKLFTRNDFMEWFRQLNKECGGMKC